MEKNYWHTKWANNDIRFHRDAVHPALEKHCRFLPGQKIFVPFSGKSLDIVWLVNRGCPVVASELSEKACDDFFKENKIHYSKRHTGDFIKYEAINLEIWCGDHFNLPENIFDGVNGWYDRAALVALPEEMRVSYCARLIKVLPRFDLSTFELFLISFEYQQPLVQGPPFSVPEVEIRKRFGAHFEVTQIETYKDESLSSNPKFSGAPVKESVYRVIPLRRGSPHTFESSSKE